MITQRNQANITSFFKLNRAQYTKNKGEIVTITILKYTNDIVILNFTPDMFQQQWDELTTLI